MASSLTAKSKSNRCLRLFFGQHLGNAIWWRVSNAIVTVLKFIKNIKIIIDFPRYQRRVEIRRRNPYQGKPPPAAPTPAADTNTKTVLGTRFRPKNWAIRTEQACEFDAHFQRRKKRQDARAPQLNHQIDKI